jgi:putative hemolysin
MEAAQRLRYEVFNLELGEGLESSVESGRDEDAFDLVCAHLLIFHRPTGAVVGTYRMQTGETAALHMGYYSEQEFDFAPFEPVRQEILELGRACVHKNHRNLAALHLLWRGIAAYAVAHGSRY